jgi:hypothetical protein
VTYRNLQNLDCSVQRAADESPALRDSVQRFSLNAKRCTLRTDYIAFKQTLATIILKKSSIFKQQITLLGSMFAYFNIFYPQS